MYRVNRILEQAATLTPDERDTLVSQLLRPSRKEVTNTPRCEICGDPAEDGRRCPQCI